MPIIVDGGLNNDNIRELQEAVLALQESGGGGGGAVPVVIVSEDRDLDADDLNAQLFCTPAGDATVTLTIPIGLGEVGDRIDFLNLALASGAWVAVDGGNEGELQVNVQFFTGDPADPEIASGQGGGQIPRGGGATAVCIDTDAWQIMGALVNAD
jgi:hypothetical protein